MITVNRNQRHPKYLSRKNSYCKEDLVSNSDLWLSRKTHHPTKKQTNKKPQTVELIIYFSGQKIKNSFDVAQENQLFQFHSVSTCHLIPAESAPQDLNMQRCLSVAQLLSQKELWDTFPWRLTVSLQQARLLTQIWAGELDPSRFFLTSPIWLSLLMDSLRCFCVCEHQLKFDAKLQKKTWKKL